MGRGRAKAKQVKVARQLKYNGGGTDLDRLRNELGIGDRDHDAVADGAEHHGGPGSGGDDADGEDLAGYDAEDYDESADYEDSADG